MQAEVAHIHRSTPTARPQARLHKYLQDMVRSLAVAVMMTGDEKRAVFLLRMSLCGRSATKPLMP